MVVVESYSSANANSSELVIFLITAAQSALQDTAEQRQTAVTAYFSSKQLLLFAFAGHCSAKTNSNSCLFSIKQSLQSSFVGKSSSLTAMSLIRGVGTIRVLVTHQREGDTTPLITMKLAGITRCDRCRRCNLIY